jgi:hypothetical protein
MSERRLIKFVATSTDGQIVAINPDYVRCLVGRARQDSKTVSIGLGDRETIAVDGDIDSVAKRLGFQLVG